MLCVFGFREETERESGVWGLFYKMADRMNEASMKERENEGWEVRERERMKCRTPSMMVKLGAM